MTLLSQTVIINGEKTSRLLRWDDFKGPPDTGSGLYAYTYWYVRYQWGPFAFSRDTAKLELEVSLELEKRSWKRADKVSDSLLAHEQGHFDIGLLFARSFRKRVEGTVLLRPDYEARIAALFREELEKYRALELLYDKETAHFHDRVQQRKWDLFFQRELGRKAPAQ